MVAAIDPPGIAVARNRAAVVAAVPRCRDPAHDQDHRPQGGSGLVTRPAEIVHPARGQAPARVADWAVGTVDQEQERAQVLAPVAGSVVETVDRVQERARATPWAMQSDQER